MLDDPGHRGLVDDRGQAVLVQEQARFLLGVLGPVVGIGEMRDVDDAVVGAVADGDELVDDLRRQAQRHVVV